MHTDRTLARHPLPPIHPRCAPPQAPLPPALFELYRWCDGQDSERPGVQFLDAARLLRLDEMRQAVQDRHGPLDTARAFAALALGDSHGPGTASAAGDAGPSCSAGAGSSSSRGGGAASCTAALLADPPAVLLPFSDELRGRRRYCLDLSGAVWLASGWNVLRAADSLPALLRRVLT